MDKFVEQAERAYWGAFPWVASDEGDKVVEVFANALRAAYQEGLEEGWTLGGIAPSEDKGKL